jgi:trk system potassium uptake protein TrkH
MFNKRYLLNIIGTLLMLESLFMIVPALVSLFYREAVFVPIILSAAITLITGSVLWSYNRNPSEDLGHREGYLIVSLIWIIYGVFGALPYVFSGYIPNFIDAVFETISGFTTTGATVLKNVEIVPHGLLFWRSMTNFIGGIGILVLFIVILPLLGTGCMALYKAETSSASIGKLQPRFKESAKRLIWIYVSFVGAETILLIISGMSVFDAVCYSFGTMSSGGFATKNASMAAFSPFSQYIVLFFMLCAGVNFNLHYFVLKGMFKKVFSDDEFRFFLLIILVAGIFISASLFFCFNLGIEPSLRAGFFQVVSFISTTGYITVNYMQWMPHMWFILFILMFIGGSAGSTAGSMKVVRYNLLYKNINVQFKKILHDRGMIHVKLNKSIVPEELMYRTLAFFFIFLVTWGISTFLLLITGLDIVSAAGIVASCMGDVGRGLGSTMLTCADVTHFGKIVLSLDMLLGRLELFSMLLIFTPYFWKSR